MATLQQGPLLFPLWKRIKLGVCRSNSDYRTELKAADIKIPFWWTKDVLSKISVSRGETHVDLIITSVREIGLGRFPTYNQFCNRALDLGMQLCPAEVGPAVRLAYLDQPEGEVLKVAMSTICDRSGRSNIFLICRFDGAVYLHAEAESADSPQMPHDRFVFVRPH